MVSQWNSVVGAFRLKRPGRCPMRILRVYHPRHGFSGNESDSKLALSLPTPTLITNSNPEVIAVGLTTAIGRLHKRDLIHKDVKPANVLLNPATGHGQPHGFADRLLIPEK
jgi:serine/threonine protein kinase